ncbi:hypothetical protein IGL98_001596 [Enterococcus sp. DIV0840]
MTISGNPGIIPIIVVRLPTIVIGNVIIMPLAILLTKVLFENLLTNTFNPLINELFFVSDIFTPPLTNPN